MRSSSPAASTRATPSSSAPQLFDIIEPFADYAFNKSHSYGYGLVAYQTAWLKANYPVEYLAALLSSVKDDKDKTAVYLAECRNLGIEVLVPDVNASSLELHRRAPTATGRQRRGDHLRPLGGPQRRRGPRRADRAEREKNGPFVDFHDFCCRVDPSVLNKRSIESLIKAGAFDSLGHPRKGLCLVFEEIIDHVLASGESRSSASRRCSRCSTRSGRRPQRRPSPRRDGRSPTSSSTSPNASRSRRRCSAST